MYPVIKTSDPIIMTVYLIIRTLCLIIRIYHCNVFTSLSINPSVKTLLQKTSVLLWKQIKTTAARCIDNHVNHLMVEVLC